MSLAIGETLHDRYRIVFELGRGGMGAVYRAEDTRLGVPVAVKEMISQPGLSQKSLDQLREQFQEEARILARLDHPNLVRVTDSFSWHDSECLVMNFVKGESLAERIERMGRVPESQALIWADQLLKALAYCHRQKIIHRDIKPQNVIIRPDGQAVLVDFGLVKLWDPDDPRTRTAMRGMGTPQYAPPEQYEAQRGHTTPQSDVYGLGATLYHALSGQVPPTATQRMADPERFKPLRETVPEVSERTEKAVMKAMELTRANRWPSAEEMAKALKAPARRPTVRLEPDKTMVMLPEERSVPDRQRHIPMWASVLVAVVVLAVGIGVGIGLGGRGDGATPTPSPEKTATVSTPAILTETDTATRPVVSTPVVMPSPTPFITATPWPTHTPSPEPRVTVMSQPTHTPSPTPLPIDTPSPTPTDTSTPTPSPTDTPSPTPSPTNTPSPTPRSTNTPTRTPTRSVQPVKPVLASPAQGETTGKVVTFRWSGSLNAGEAYQVALFHPNSNSTIPSPLLSVQEWTADLPGDKYGEWRWTVAVIRGGAVAARSEEWTFWFDPGMPTQPPGPQPSPTVPPP
jgi:serine/threonine protein kinase